ncbi:Zinc finger protein 346 [Frankliniella fusca]|uniref:Zinc finger protein 346 n=1 Tax=Frankliniella fusca TaxID=407009 RepID=A0AAE1HR21_9NEOP|nr:Zinc finger protein 346 [Frankliniella fusca]
MRQTRRSRSAATPHKDEAPPQTEEAKETVKANLETVFEKEGDARDDAGAAVSAVNESSSATLPSESEVSLQDETKLLEETVCNSADIQSEVVGSTPSVGSSSPLKTAAAPKMGQTPLKNSEVIELNCKVCNCSFTNYQEHMNSEAHKSKISHSSPKTDGSNSDKTPTPIQAQKRAGDQALDSTPSAKRMKNQNQTAQNASDKFRCDVCNASMAKQQDYDLHMNGKRHLLNVTRAQGKAYCDICKLFFNTVTDLNDHTDSQLHKTNVANRKTDKEPFDCKVCNITVQGKRQYEQHLSSKRHKRSLANPTAAKKPTAAPPSAAAATTAAPPATAGAASATVNGKSESNTAESQKKWLYICNACNYGCNQDQQFSSHMNLADHKAAVIDMKKKGLVKDQVASKPTPVKAPAPKPAPANNATQNVRKFPHNNAAVGPRNFAGPQGAGNRPQNFANKPGPNQGPVTKVTYNVVPGNMSAGGQTGVPPKQGPVKRDGPQANRKGPLGGPGGPAVGAPVGPNKPTPLNKPIMINKPPMTGRPNPRFGGPGENQQNKFTPSAQPLKLAFQKMPFEGPGNFGSHAFGNVGDANNAGGNFGNYGPRQTGNFGANLRNDNINQTSDVRGDFRGNMRDDYRSDIRDLRDLRNIEMGMDNRGDSNFRSGYYRDMPVDSARDNRSDYSNFRGGDMSIDVRSDMRSGLAADARGDMRGITRNDLGADIRSYNSDMRDMRTDSRNDFMRDRNTNYGGVSSFGQQNYRGNDDYRSDNYSRGSQLSSQASSGGGYSSGMMSSSRYDSSFLDRNSSSVYNNQYAGQSRGMGFMGDMTLNGR